MPATLCPNLQRKWRIGSKLKIVDRYWNLSLAKNLEMKHSGVSQLLVINGDTCAANRPHSLRARLAKGIWDNVQLKVDLEAGQSNAPHTADTCGSELHISILNLKANRVSLEDRFIQKRTVEYLQPFCRCLICVLCCLWQFCFKGRLHELDLSQSVGELFGKFKIDHQKWWKLTWNNRQCIAVWHHWFWRNKFEMFSGNPGCFKDLTYLW